MRNGWRLLMLVFLLCLLPSQGEAQESVSALGLKLRAAAYHGAELGRPRSDGFMALRRIVIDPGHGGRNEGAIGVGGVLEKHLTLPIALHLADRLQAEHPALEVLLTRRSDRDLGLAERAEIANKANADLLISLHFNAALNTEAIGFETFWSAPPKLPALEGEGFSQRLSALFDYLHRAQSVRHAGERSMRFAGLVNQALGRRFDVLDRGVKRGDFTVLTEAKVPAVVIELGFLTHADEGLDVLAPAQQARMVDALIDALERYDVRLADERSQAVASAGD